MKKNYDFSEAQRGAVVASKGKRRISIMLDDAVIEAARAKADEQGIGYQTLINSLLREKLGVAKTATRGQNPAFDGLGIDEMKTLETQLRTMANSLHALLDAKSKILTTET